MNHIANIPPLAVATNVGRVDVDLGEPCGALRLAQVRPRIRSGGEVAMAPSSRYADSALSEPAAEGRSVMDTVSLSFDRLRLN